MHTLLYSYKYTHIYALHSLPTHLPPYRLFLCPQDLIWLNQCSHQKRKESFIKGRWLAYSVTRHAVKRGRHGSTHTHNAAISITHRDNLAIMASYPAQQIHKHHNQYPDIYIGVDIEKHIASSKFAYWIIQRYSTLSKKQIQRLNTNISINIIATIIFSAREALMKALGNHNQILLSYHYRCSNINILQYSFGYHCKITRQKNLSHLHHSIHPPSTFICHSVPYRGAKGSYILSSISENIHRS